MKLSRVGIATFLLASMFLATAFAATDAPQDGNPTYTAGSAIWGLKAGTTNTKQAVESTNGALNVMPQPTSSAGQGMAEVPSTAAESNHVMKAGAGNLFSITITTGASAGFLMIFNATSAPADGAVAPVYCVPVAAASATPLQWNYPVVFSTGITAVFSTTGCFSKTASATAAFFAQVQ